MKNAEMDDGAANRPKSRETSPNKGKKPQTSAIGSGMPQNAPHQTPGKFSTLQQPKRDEPVANLFAAQSNATFAPQSIDIGIKDLVDITASKNYLYRALAGTGK